MVLSYISLVLLKSFGTARRKQDKESYVEEEKGNALEDTYRMFCNIVKGSLAYKRRSLVHCNMGVRRVCLVRES